MAIIITIMTTRFEGQRNSKGSEDNHGPDVVGGFTGAVGPYEKERTQHDRNF